MRHRDACIDRMPKRSRHEDVRPTKRALARGARRNWPDQNLSGPAERIRHSRSHRIGRRRHRDAVAAGQTGIDNVPRNAIANGNACANGRIQPAKSLRHSGELGTGENRRGRCKHVRRAGQRHLRSAARFRRVWFARIETDGLFDRFDFDPQIDRHQWPRPRIHAQLPATEDQLRIAEPIRIANAGGFHA